MSIGVLICDDQALVRAGFRKLLEADAEIEVVGEAEDGIQAVELARRRAPVLVLMDIRMPRLDGIEATRRIVAESGPATRVLMLTTFGSDEYVYESLRAGASAFLLKDAPPEELLGAIRIVARGDALLAPAVTRAVVEAFVRSSPARPEHARALDELTSRELEVLQSLARGRSNAEIAEALVVSEATVKTHVAHILTKLGVRDELYPEVVDGPDEEGGVPSRLLKTDAGVGRQEGTPWRMFAGSPSGRTTRSRSRSTISPERARVA